MTIALTLRLLSIFLELYNVDLVLSDKKIFFFAFYSHKMLWSTSIFVNRLNDVSVL